VNASGHSGLCASLLSSVLVEPVDPRRLLGMVNVASTFAAGYPGPPLPVVSTHQAFVVGVNEYSGAGFRLLTKAVNDAVDVAAALETGGFSVHSFANLPRSQFVEAFDTFCQGLTGARSVVIHFSGHGLAPSSEIFLAASDSAGGWVRLTLVLSARESVQVCTPILSFLFASSHTDAPESWVRVNWMLSRLFTATPTAAVTFFLDCCRQVAGVVPPYDPPVFVGGRYVDLLFSLFVSDTYKKVVLNSRSFTAAQGLCTEVCVNYVLGLQPGLRPCLCGCGG
jgi:uncharacterized caspase-like protein